jgi:hypothetical protein
MLAWLKLLLLALLLLLFVLQVFILSILPQVESNDHTVSIYTPAYKNRTEAYTGITVLTHKPTVQGKIQWHCQSEYSSLTYHKKRIKYKKT